MALLVPLRAARATLGAGREAIGAGCEALGAGRARGNLAAGGGSCGGREVPVCAPCATSRPPACRGDSLAPRTAQRVVCCPPPQGQRPPCAPRDPPCSLSCLDAVDQVTIDGSCATSRTFISMSLCTGGQLMKIILINKVLTSCGINPESSKRPNHIDPCRDTFNIGGCDQDPVALRLRLAKCVQEAAYWQEVAERACREPPRAPRADYCLHGQQECARATDGCTYAVLPPSECAPAPPRCGPGRTPPPPRCVELAPDDACRIRDDAHLDPCAHRPRIMIEIDRGASVCPPPGTVCPPPGTVCPPPGTVCPPPGTVCPPPGTKPLPPGNVFPPPGGHAFAQSPPASGGNGQAPRRAPTGERQRNYPCHRPGTQAPPPGTVCPPPGTVCPPPGTKPLPPGNVFPPPGTVCPPPGTVCPPPGTVCPPPGTVCPPPGTKPLPPGNVFPPPGTVCPPPGTVCPPPGTVCPPPGTVCPPPGTVCPPPERTKPSRPDVPPARHQAPPARQRVPPARHRVPPARHRVPPARHRVPPPGTVCPPPASGCEDPVPRWCANPPPLAPAPPRCRRPSILERLRARPPESPNERRIHTSIILSKGKNCSKSKTTAGGLQNMLRSKQQLNEAGLGRVVVCNEAGRTEQKAPGGRLELSVPAGTRRVAVLVSLEGATGGACPPLPAPQLCAPPAAPVCDNKPSFCTKTSTTSARPDSWLSIKQIQKKLNRCGESSSDVKASSRSPGRRHGTMAPSAPQKPAPPATRCSSTSALLATTVGVGSV
ncbi:hypothetical protein SFRURICE_004180 [Spodoptera frugiperda]|nr:hypothetical protein SFRURICE_004180 [Spodoptera frugiperda]